MSASICPVVMFKPYRAPQSHNERVCVSVLWGMIRNSSQSGAPAPDSRPARARRADSGWCRDGGESMAGEKASAPHV